METETTRQQVRRLLGMTYAQAERELDRGRVSDRAFTRFDRLWCWSCYRYSVRASFYARADYRARIDRVKRAIELADAKRAARNIVALESDVAV